MQTATLRVSTLSSADVAELITSMTAAFDRMRAGQRPDASWCELVDALNVAEALAQAGIAADRMPEIMAGQQALLTLLDRHAATGSWTMRGAEITALDEALLMAKAQVHYMTYGELSDAIEAVKRRAAQALAGNHGHRVNVVGMLGQPA